MGEVSVRRRVLQVSETEVQGSSSWGLEHSQRRAGDRSSQEAQPLGPSVNSAGIGSRAEHPLSAWPLTSNSLAQNPDSFTGLTAFSSPLERQRSNFRTPPSHRSHIHPSEVARDLKATLTKDQHLGEVRNFLHRMPAGYWRFTHHHRRHLPDERRVFTATRLLIHCLALTTPVSPWGAPSWLIHGGNRQQKNKCLHLLWILACSNSSL